MLQYQVAVVGNLHLMATVLSILAYFSRRSWLVTGVGLTLRALTPRRAIPSVKTRGPHAF